MPVSALYAAIFALLYIVLSLRIVKLRQNAKALFGNGDDERLSRAIRVHGNFSEYVPFALVLIYFLEISTHNALLTHIAAVALLLARLSHAYGFSQINENLRYRAFGMSVTMSVIGITAGIIILNYLFF
jgi:uncharacterized membrane protein YecN with MAPEG domain